MASGPLIPNTGPRAFLRSAATALAKAGRDDNALGGRLERLSRVRERQRDGDVAKALDVIRTAARSDDLAADYASRIDALGAIRLDSRARRAAFPEFIQAFSLEPLRLVMASDFCSCTPENHALQMAGRLFHWDQPVATWHRELVLDAGIVVHHLLEIGKPFRAAGVGPALLLNGLQLYDQLGMQRIVLQAGLETGKWHWARCGFDFLPGGGGDEVIDFYNTLVQLLGLPIDTSRFTSASEYALAEPDVTLSMSRLASLLGSSAAPVLREIAHKNDIDFYAQIPASKAIMLSGPEWSGVLRLQGPQRAAFEAYLFSRVRAVRRRLDQHEA